MLYTLRQRAEEERGFTLIELLIVVLIIGILAAIAVPTLLGRQKGQDTSAKSDARNMVSYVESCFADQHDYTKCNTAAALGTTGLDQGAGQGQVHVMGVAVDGYTVDAHSRTGNHFFIKKKAGGPSVRHCTAPGTGSCPIGGSW